MIQLAVGIIGGGQEATVLLRVLMELKYVSVLGVADPDLHAPAMELARQMEVFVTADYHDIVNLKDIEVIFELTGLPQVLAEIEKLRRPGVSIVDSNAARLFTLMAQEKQKLLEAKKLKGELKAILNSVQEGIEVVDNEGFIKYVNPTFTRMTGIPEEARIGQNIFEVSPHGALAEALIKQKPVYGHRTKVGGSQVEVISNAAPIVIEGQLEGAVVVFQPVTDLLKLMDELKESNDIIESLYSRIGQITGSKYTFDDLVGSGKTFQATLEMAKKAARGSCTVLITGESGTGKEMYAHAIHHGSTRRHKPFIKVNCASIPESLLESELFGCEKGAFTGATHTRLGKVELAHEGTLFLDEIGNMNTFVQAKLLRLLQDQEFERVGGSHPIKVDVRVIATTSRDLKTLVRKGLFNEELYCRLNVIELNLPPLRARREDILALAKQFLDKFNRKLGKSVRKITPEALQLLMDYDWPGNVRELESVVERAMVTVDGDQLSHRHLVQYLGRFEATRNYQFMEVMPLDKMERLMLKAALARYGDTLEGKKKAAQALNISLATLYNKLKKYKTNLS